MKRSVVCVTILFGAMGLFSLFLFPILNSGRPHWPPIDSPAQLRQEATTLCRDHPVGFVEDSAWPAGIAALKPRLVLTDGQSVRVIISGGGTTGLDWGYIIWPDTMPRSDGGVLQYDASHER